MQSNVKKAMLAEFKLLLKDFEEDSILSIAVYFKNYRMLVWAEIKDNREDIEGQLIMTEAKINAKYCKDGYHMMTTIVEKSDMLPIPSQYGRML